MARIIGTKRADSLLGTEAADLIRGRAGDDVIDGVGGEDRIYGDLGNDTITDWFDRSEIYGGRGDDTIYFSRGYAYGGVGNDFIGVYGGGGWAIGGKGDDYLEGGGALWGDEGPGALERVAGNDTLVIGADLDSARGHGGLGNDKFIVWLDGEGSFELGIVDDFRSGEDKVQVMVALDPGEGALDLFNYLDRTGDGFLNFDDTLAGGQVWIVEEANAMVLGYGEARVVVHGATQLSHATDWLV